MKSEKMKFQNIVRSFLICVDEESNDIAEISEKTSHTDRRNNKRARTWW